MAIAERNEAAERLQSHIRAGDNLSETIEYHADLLMQALAAERRATVERIREALLDIGDEHGFTTTGRIRRILDAEAQR